MSAARAPSSGRRPTRARTSAFQSGMANPGDAVQRRKEGAPAAALRAEDLAAGRGEPVEAPPPHAGLLDPAAEDQPTALQAVQRRVEGGDVKGDRPVRAIVNQPGDFVAVSIALFEQREDQGFGAAFAQLAVGRHMAGAYV